MCSSVSQHCLKSHYNRGLCEKMPENKHSDKFSKRNTHLLPPCFPVHTVQEIILLLYIIFLNFDVKYNEDNSFK